jgi:prepilin-type N-terminal cleavage/methylation domain-containing protein
MMKKKSVMGFSLMELLAVMAIMGILATVAVTGYFSAVRSMTRRRAVSNIVATLQQARQRACIDGTRMAVVCYSENSLDPKPNMYVVCKALGRVTREAGNKIGDEFTPLDLIFGKASTGTGGDIQYAFENRRIYNLSSDKGGFVDVKGSVEPGDDVPLESGITGSVLSNTNQTLLWCFVAQGGQGDRPKVGDLYGVEAAPVAVLPKNIYFSSEKMLMFKPDGSAINGSIQIVDRSVKSDEKKIATITVDSTGGITGGGNNEIILN